LTEAGVEFVGWAISDADTPYDTGYQYIAVWKMSSRKEVGMLEQGIENAGWHDHFEQVNARGELVPPPQVLERMVRG
jgi:hypothetical protein